jgi:hypothetical protein
MIVKRLIKNCSFKLFTSLYNAIKIIIDLVFMKNNQTKDSPDNSHDHGNNRKTTV